MTNASTAMPAGILGGIAGAMLIFIWWWFPRTWIRGVVHDNNQLEDMEVQAHRQMVVDNARSIVDNYRRTLKERELAKSVTAQSIMETDVEAQDSTPNPATDVATEAATDTATNPTTHSAPDPPANPSTISTSTPTDHPPAPAT